MPHLDLFGFNPGKIEKIQKICLTSVTEFSLLRKKKVVSSAYAVYKN